MTPQIMVVWIGAFFAMVVIGVITLFVLSIFWDSANPTSGIFANGSQAANASNQAQVALEQLFGQMPNVGRLAGVAMIIGVLGLMGVGGYVGYTKIRGM